MTSTDYLIWVGKSYSRVICSKKTCAIPLSNKSSHCYIHEAEWRGCCRKVPQIPPQAIIGRTRIFLAHRDRLKRKEQGRIIGYYILKGIEVIADVRQPLRMPMQEFKKLKKPHNTIMMAKCWDGTKIKATRLIETSSPLLTPLSECEHGSIKEKQCDDGKKVTTHECIGGHWVKTNERCEEDVDDPESHDSIPPEQTIFETERACSLRLKPGSIYFVDALAKEITAQFSDNLKKDKLREEYIKATSRSKQETLIKRGRKIFIDTVTEVNNTRKTYTVIPTKIQKKASLRGELVFFHNKTVFEKYPSASFKGLSKVDGDAIIEQVAKGISKIEISFPDKDFFSCLAKSTKSSKAFVKRFIDALIKTAKNELRVNNKFKIPGFGELHVIQTKKRKLIEFEPYKKLKNFGG